MNNNKIYVTKPFLPPLEDYSELLAKVWTSKQLTNAGQLHQKLERKLAKYLGVKYLSLVNNGTMGLVIAQRALGLGVKLSPRLTRLLPRLIQLFGMALSLYLLIQI